MLMEPASLPPGVKEKAVAHLRRACQARPVHVYTLAMKDTLDTRLLEVDKLEHLGRVQRQEFLLTGAVQ